MTELPIIPLVQAQGGLWYLDTGKGLVPMQTGEVACALAINQIVKFIKEQNQGESDGGQEGLAESRTE
jgi:hypothetical protein